MGGCVGVLGMPVDLIDKQILQLLDKNPRASYRALARAIGLSVTAIRNRVLKLEASNVIRRYKLYPSFAMLGVSFCTAILNIANPPPSEELRERLGTHPMIEFVNFLADGNVMCFGNYDGSKGLDELTLFLHELEPVNDIEFHTLLFEKGKKCTLTSMHLQVLRCLREDVRMPVSKIAQLTRLTQRRVRKLLADLIGTNGSLEQTWFHEKGVGDYRTTQQCFHPRVDCDVAEAGSTRFLARISFRGGDEQRRKIVGGLKHEYPLEYWFSYASASAPVLFSMFIVEVANYSPQIINRIKELDGVESVRPIVNYAHHFYPGPFDRFWEQLFGSSEHQTKT
jgi:DNA-binding Lrp family transcriptional regulator